MRKVIASAVLVGLVLLPATAVSAATSHGGGGGNGERASLLGLARLTSEAGSTATGAVFMAYDPKAGKIALTIEVSGLAPNSMHPAHIHQGSSCAANGPILYPLPMLRANAQGIAMASTEVDVQSIPATGWYVNVHQGPTLMAGPTPIACGLVRQASAAAQLTAEAGSNVEGLALLARTGTTTDVIDLITGLAPNSVHPEHIHLGLCTSNGPILYSLPMLHADANGTAVATTSIPTAMIPRAGVQGWYINVHQGPTLMTGPTPIGCGVVAPTFPG